MPRATSATATTLTQGLTGASFDPRSRFCALRQLRVPASHCGRSGRRNLVVLAQLRHRRQTVPLTGRQVENLARPARVRILVGGSGDPEHGLGHIKLVCFGEVRAIPSLLVGALAARMLTSLQPKFDCMKTQPGVAVAPHGLTASTPSSRTDFDHDDTKQIPSRSVGDGNRRNGTAARNVGLLVGPVD
jgi:hypothetical protein